MAKANSIKLFLGIANKAFKTKAGKIIKDDFSDAINNEVIAFWKKVRPIFIKDEEGEELAQKLESGTIIENEKDFLQYKLDFKAKNNEELSNEIKTFIDHIENKQTDNSKDINTNVGIVAKTVEIKGKYVSGRDQHFNKGKDQ